MRHSLSIANCSGVSEAHEKFISWSTFVFKMIVHRFLMHSGLFKAIFEILSFIRRVSFLEMAPVKPTIMFLTSPVRLLKLALVSLGISLLSTLRDA